MKKILKKFWWVLLLLIGGAVVFAKRRTIFTKSNTLKGTMGKGITYYCPQNKVSQKLLDILNKISEEVYNKYQYDLYRKTSSVFRCEPYNKIVGGSPSSSHIKGLAADLKLTKEQAINVIKIAKKHGVKRFLWYPAPNMHLHMDIDTDKPPVEYFYG